jgi:hypothetical protein
MCWRLGFNGVLLFSSVVINPNADISLRHRNKFIRFTYERFRRRCILVCGNSWTFFCAALFLKFRGTANCGNEFEIKSKRKEDGNRDPPSLGSRNLG